MLDIILERQTMPKRDLFQCAPSSHAKPKNLNTTQGIKKPLRKQMTISSQETDQPSQHLEKKGSPERYAQCTI